MSDGLEPYLGCGSGIKCNNELIDVVETLKVLTCSKNQRTNKLLDKLAHLRIRCEMIADDDALAMIWFLPSRGQLSV